MRKERAKWFSHVVGTIKLDRTDWARWQMQGHWGCSFGFCDTDFGLIGFGMNSMGARFNPVSISIVNSESSTAYEAAFIATKKGLY